MNIYEELKNLAGELNNSNIPYALCGGMALAVYGIQRATIDIDMLIEEDSLDKIIAIARNLGFTHRPGKMVFREGTVKIERIVKFDQEQGDELQLDLLLVTPELETIWKNRKRRILEWGELSVVSREGLINLKRLRGSGIDQDDIQKLEEKSDEG